MVECQLNTDTQTLTCSFSGRMDIVNTREDEKIVSRQMAETAGQKAGALRIIFDMGGVEYIASSFLRFCLATAKLVKKGHFAVVNTNPFIKKIFIMAGFDRALNVS